MIRAAAHELFSINGFELDLRVIPVVSLRIDYSSSLSKIFKARLLQDLIRAAKETSIDR